MRILLFLCIISFSSLAPAEDYVSTEFPPRLKMPDGFEAKTEGGDMQCFVNTDYNTLIRISAQYQSLYDWRLEALGEMNAFDLALESRDRTIGSLERVIRTLKDDREWLTLRLSQSGDTILANNNGFQYERYALWAVILIETGYILVQGIRAQ